MKYFALIFIFVSLILSLFVSQNSFAIDAVSPESTCDRFQAKLEKKKCLEKIKKIQPDSYLSAICEKQFDDDAFFDCMETADVATFDPLKVSKCDDGQLSDQARIECVRSVADYHQKNEGQSDRTPASSGKSKKKKKK